jgi:arginyl-tRNA synthetase
MNDAELKAVETLIQSYCREAGLPEPEALQWSPIPFAGEWGVSTSFFQTAALEARSQGSAGVAHPPVPQRAQEIAAAVAVRAAALPGFSHVEAVKGYLNLYYPTAEYTQRVVQTILAQGADYGRGEAKGERVMVEYAQPNTHHSFHMGHFRNALLGEVLARLVEFAGFETIRATYPGDLGLGVITILWIYQKFYRGQEPQGIHERGQWLLKLYVEATALLEPKENETPEQKEQREGYEAERREIYRRWDAAIPRSASCGKRHASGAWKSCGTYFVCWTSTWMCGSTRVMWMFLPSKSSKSWSAWASPMTSDRAAR